jgi:hypothetical protein
MIWESTVLAHVKVLIVMSPEETKSKSKIYNIRFCQSIFVSGTHLGPVTNFSSSFFFFCYFFRHLRVCWYATPSPTRGLVCSFQLLLGLASAVFLGSESEYRGTHKHILLPQFWSSPSLEGQVPVIISPTSRIAQLYQGLRTISLTSGGRNWRWVTDTNNWPFLLRSVESVTLETLPS